MFEISDCFDHEMDALESRIYDDRDYDSDDLKCKWCGSSNVVWNEIYRGKFVLFRKDNVNKKHICGDEYGFQ